MKIILNVLLIAVRVIVRYAYAVFILAKKLQKNINNRTTFIYGCQLCLPAGPLEKSTENNLAVLLIFFGQTAD